MEEVPAAEERAHAPQLTLASLLSAFLGISAVAAGAVVLAGWQYVREYYREFGIEPSALSFSPYEYALHARFALGLVVLTAVSGGLGFMARATADYVPESHWLNRVFPPVPGPRELRTVIVFWWIFVAIVVGFGLVDYYVTKKGFYLFSLCIILALWTIQVATWFALHRREWFFFGVASMVAVLALVILFIPGEQGKTDARRHRDNIERFLAVSIVASDELGLPEHQAIDPFHKYGPYRLILHNGGMYYVVAEEEPDTILAVPEASITHLQFHRER